MDLMTLTAEPLLHTASARARAPAAAFRAEVVTRRQDFAAVGPEWDALALRTSITPMARHSWLMAAAEACEYEALATVVVRDAAGELRAAAPLARKRFGPFRRLVWLSHEMGEPQRLLHDDPAALEVLWAQIRRLRLPLEARRLTPHGEEMAILRRGGGLRTIRLGSTQTIAAPVADWAAFERAMSGNARQEIRRKRKGLEKEGAVAFHAVSPDAETVDGWLDALLRVESSGWKGRERSAIVHRPLLARFFRDYARRAAREGTLRMFFLSLDGENIAAQMLAETGGRLWQYKIGYDERWSRWSPGRLLMFEILRWAHEQGLEAVEYLGHGGGWQTRWPATFTPHASLRWYPVTPSAAAAFALDTVEFVRRKLSPARAGDPPKKDKGAPAPEAGA